MAEEQEGGSEDKTEAASEERRDEFRERGQVHLSRELTSVLVLGGCIIAFTSGAPGFLKQIEHLMVKHFEDLSTARLTPESVLEMGAEVWIEILQLCVPAFLVTAATATVATLAQTRLNWSWERVMPDFSRLEPFSGLMRMVNTQALGEVVKSLAKMSAVSLVAYLILHSEWRKVPELMTYPLHATWMYWGSITRSLFWAVTGFLFLIAAVDFIWNYMSLEKQMRMTKQEVKKEFKDREIDQHVKSKMRKMARDLATRKTLAKTRTATVVITNPTHFSIALKYEPGDRAPIVVAKGIDLLALEMRKIAKELDIPIIENRPVARELYATVKEGEEIPDKFYKIVAEIIRYVFRVKGRRLPQKTPKVTSNIRGVDVIQ